MENFNPLISICIPTYNRLIYLKDSINSALNQTYNNYEIIIIDQSEGTETELYVTTLNSTKIKYYRKEHKNAPDARNYAIINSIGEYLLWLDDDDYIQPNLLEMYVEYLNKFTDIDILYCKIIAFSNEMKVLRKFDYKDYYLKNDELIPFLLLHGQPIPNGGSLFKRKVFNEIGFYNIEFDRAHDYEFYTRVILKNKYKIKYVDEYLYFYRIHEKNITLNLSGQINYSYEIRIMKSLLNNNKLIIFFPNLEWEKDEKKALAEAYYAIGIKFFNYVDYPDSLFYLIASLRLNPLFLRLKHIIESFIQVGLIEEIKMLLYFTKDFYKEVDELNEVIKLIENYNIKNN